MSGMIRIRSGGQTGADRAALDAALDAGVECGGWCPAGRQAEDGRIPNRYPLTELADAGYAQRTLRNVTDSDGAVIFYFDTPMGGTELTLAFCIEQQRPYLLIDACEMSEIRAVERIRRFVECREVADLNVAGPRAGDEQRVYAYVYKALSTFFKAAEMD